MLRRAVELQARERGRRTLGQILIATSGLTAEDLRAAVATQLEQAVAEIVTWNDGTFDFALDDLRPIDDISLLPSDAPAEAYLETQMVLLEAARIFDERDRLEFDEDEVQVRTGMPEGVGGRGCGRYRASSDSSRLSRLGKTRGNRSCCLSPRTCPSR